ncbi:MAG: pyridoxal phosphate-dependent aminotransferase [Candidatus Woesearchaeota archaeon]|nr:MAG: pyridoxal phosphate-dependent aminotransferase [Candidatus Woesearchaeota archaeon]
MAEAFNIFNTFMNTFDKKGKKVDAFYLLNNGDVDRFHFPLPPVLERAIRSKLDSRKYGYSRPQGNDGICKKIAQYEKTISNSPISQSNIALTSGVTSGLEMILDLLKKEGTLLLPTPSYPLGEALAERHNIPTIKFQTKEENNYLLTASELETQIDDTVRLLLLTNPNNPTGIAYSKTELDKIKDICQRKEIYLIIDEIFSGLMLNGNSHHIPSYNINSEKVIRLNGWSKDRGVAGFRIGYIVAPDSIIRNLSETISLTMGNAPTVFNNFISKDMLLRRLLLEEGNIPETVLLEYNEYKAQITSNLRKYERNKQLITSYLSEVDRITYLSNTMGGYCMFIKFDAVSNTESFLRDLYKNTGVLLVPGSGFNCTEPGWARLSFSVDPIRLEKGLEAMSSYL